MSFVRPEARATLWRWREVLVGAALAVVGVWMIAKGYGIVPWVGGAGVLISAALVYAGLQRGRFRRQGRGPGVVALDEGAIVYFGPLTGGALALSDLESVTLDGTGHPQHWVLSAPGQAPLAIPVTVDGADRLFDAFASLPGFSPERMLSALKAGSSDRQIVWRRNAPAGRARQIR